MYVLTANLHLLPPRTLSVCLLVALFQFAQTVSAVNAASDYTMFVDKPSCSHTFANISSDLKFNELSYVNISMYGFDS